MEKELIGALPDGRQIHSYSFSFNNGASFSVMDYGACLLKLEVSSDRMTDTRDVVLGFSDVKDYFFKNDPCFGMVIGPHANRIADASFEFNGKVYQVDKNDGNNFNHKDSKGWHTKVWDIKSVDDGGITFELYSPEGDCGFPGDYTCEVSYTFRDNALMIDYRAKAKSDGVFSPTNHSYFNLNGHSNGTIKDHGLIIYAEDFLPGGSDSVTRGELRKVENTPFDFREKKLIGRDIDSDYDEIVYGKGYDHCFVLNERFSEAGMEMYHAAKLFSGNEDLVMDVYTTQPGMMMYTANWFTGEETAKDNKKYQARSGVAFETQFFPNSLNIPQFKQPVIRAGEEKHYRTVFKFS